MKAGTGTLWRIRRVQPAAGSLPPRPRSMPLYLLQFVVLPAAALATLIAVIRSIIRRRGRR
jgi:hypothetical protein